MTGLAQFSLEGRVAVVTGASSGLGVALAIGLATAGADVVLAARRTELLEVTAAAVAQTGRQAVVVRADVSNDDQCGHVVAQAVKELGNVDILVNNAGIAYSSAATRDAPGQFEHVLDVNLTGAYRMSQHCARVMRPGSSIINISSVHAQTRSDLPTSAYAASKAGLLALTRDLANQWSERKGIRVNAVVPGYFDTPMMDATRSSDAAFGLDVVRRRSILQRLGEPAELVGPVVFLAGEASAYMTGSTLTVDGGLTA